MDKLQIPAVTSELDNVIDFVTTELEEHGFGMKAINQIAIATEEIFVNIASYAYPDKTGEAEIDIAFDKDSAVICFTDAGRPYNPLEKEDPDTTLSAEERSIGGLGIYMTKKLTDTIDYEHKNGKNILKITKNLC